MSSTTTGTTERHGPAGVNDDALLRLRTIAGQITGIVKMVEREEYCVDILNQIRAVRAALHRTGVSVLRRHLEHCVSEAVADGGESRDRVVDELVTIFDRQES
jgi:DNA-binding FrmR family transcriptional regulator